MDITEHPDTGLPFEGVSAIPLLALHPTYAAPSASSSPPVFAQDEYPSRFRQGSDQRQAQQVNGTKVAQLEIYSLAGSTTTRSIRRTKPRHHLFLDWWQEILASIFSLAAFSALVAVLRKYNNRPLTDWSYYGLSLNAMISILATAIRVTSMVPVATSLLQRSWLHVFTATPGRGQRLEDMELYHNASRGPLGSLKLLNVKRFRTASVGAALTILALGFDVFSQQVVHLVPLPVRSNTTTIPSVVGSLDRYLDQSMFFGALYNGIYSTSIPALILPCATGNCEWPITPTIGVCGACQDISSYITTTCNTSSNTCTFTTPPYSDAWGRALGFADFDAWVCENGANQYSFSGGNVSLTTPLLNVPHIPNAYDISYAVTQVTAVGLGSGLVLQNRTGVSASTIETIVALFDVLNIDMGYVPNFSDNRSAIVYGNLTAQECGLWPCVQTLKVVTRNGSQTQTLVDSWAAGYAPREDTMFSDIPASIALNVSFTDPGDIFQMALCGSGASKGETGNGAVSLFAGNGSLVPPGTEYSSTSVITAIHEQLLRNSNLDDWIQQVGTSLTNDLRSTGANLNDTRFVGSVYTMETFITIRWMWLTLPALIVVLSVLFLAMVMVETESTCMPAWKGNPLNLLFCKVDSELETQVGEGMQGGQGKRGVRGRVGEAKVRLKREGDGRWAFVEDA